MPNHTNFIRLDDSLVANDGVTVATITHAEKKNALSHQLRLELADAFETAAADPRHRVMVLTGDGDVFSAGFDLSEFGALEPATLWASADRLHRAMLLHPVPVVAAVNGPAYAGGADLVTLADLRVGGAHSVLAHPEREKFPVMYGPLRELVGASVARELVLTGRSIQPEEAQRIGLLTELVTDGRTPLDRGLELARDVARTPRDLLETMKTKMTRQTAFQPILTTLAL